MVVFFLLSVERIKSPHVALSYTKHLWATGQYNDAKDQLGKLIIILENENELINSNVDLKLLCDCQLRLGNWVHETISEEDALQDVNNNMFNFSC